MKKLISLLLFVAIAIMGIGIVAPEKMPVSGETKDLLYAMNEKGSYIFDGIKKVAVDIGITVRAVGKATFAKAKKEVNELEVNTATAKNKIENKVEVAKVKMKKVANSLSEEYNESMNNSKNEINKNSDKEIVINSKVDVVAFKIHDNPNDNISIEKEIASAKASYNAKNKNSNNISNKKLVEQKNTAKIVVKNQKKKNSKNSIEINFPFNSSNLTKVALNKLSEIELDVNSKITIAGHTDNVGSTASNTYYSKNRAIEVRKYFVKKGVKKENISIKYLGATKPIASNSNLKGRRANRRVKISIIN